MSVGGIWEFIKGLTARVICLEDAVNLKNMEIEDLTQRLSQLSHVVSDIRKDRIIAKQTNIFNHSQSRNIKPTINQIMKDSFHLQLNNSNQRITSQRSQCSITSKQVVGMKTPKKQTLSTSQSSQRSYQNILKADDKIRNPSSAKNKYDKIQSLNTNSMNKKPIFLKKVSQPKNIYINIAQVTQQTDENEQFYDPSNVINEKEQPYKITPVAHEDNETIEQEKLYTQYIIQTTDDPVSNLNAQEQEQDEDDEVI